MSSEKYLNGFWIEGDNSSLKDTDQSLLSCDLICEGPVDGLVDKDGYLLKFLKDEKYSNIYLGKGIYYNDTPIIETNTNLFNFVSRGYEFINGEEASSFEDYPSTVFRYNQRLYLPAENYNKAIELTTNGLGIQKNYSNPEEGRFFAAWAKEEDFYQNYYSSTAASAYSYGVTQKFASFEDIAVPVDNISVDEAASWMETAKINSSLFSHKIKNKNTDELIVNFNADQCYSYDGDGTVKKSSLDFCIEVSHDGADIKYFILVPVNLISKGSRIIPVKLNLDLNPFSDRSYYVNIFMLARRVPINDGTTSRVAFVDSIVERVRRKGKFNYPNTVICKSIISSQHFKSDPSRTFDIKGLKVKVPSNYDPDAREYYGHWDGTFSKFLKWTDNPAWIYYDICTNQRYGVGTGKVLSEDLNKWELYRIAKYCDELIKSSTSRAGAGDDFTYYPEMSNAVFVEKVNIDSDSDVTLQSMIDKYKPISKLDLNTGKFSFNSGDDFTNVIDSYIYLYDISNGKHANTKKIIWSISEGVLYESSDGTMNFRQTYEGQGSVFRFICGKNFSPSFFLENEPNSDSNAFDYVLDNANSFDQNGGVSTKSEISKRILEGAKTSEAYIKSLLLFYIYQVWSSGYGDWAKLNFVDTDIFDGEANIRLQGKCLPNYKDSKNALEPRFSANLYIDNETEVLKLLNDLASVFRGLTYYRNNLITTTIDVAKPISYLFNNTNVKDGLFTYSTGSLDGNYSVAKVLYRDKDSNFDENIEVVEDSELIKEFGIVSKEILGFGVTSKDQARRMGLWLLATNRFENQTVTFTTDIQGLMLKPGDVIQIEDYFRSRNSLQGRVVDINIDSDNDANNYIVVDRKINTRFAGDKIKFLFKKSKKSINDIKSSFQYSDFIDSNVIELIIDRVDNKNNRIYFKDVLSPSERQSENFYNFSKITVSTPFLIEGYSLSSKDLTETVVNDFSDKAYLNNKNLFKIVSISEQDINEYGFFAVKYDRNKYLSLDQNLIKVNNKTSQQEIYYSSSDNLTELDLVGMGNSYYEISRLSLSELNNNTFDFSFSESSNFIQWSDTHNYASINLKFIDITKYIVEQANANNEYYKECLSILQNSGGFICKISSKNQSIKFKVSSSEINDKVIFLGKYPSALDNSGVISLKTGVKIYLYDKNNKIVEV